MTSKNYILPLKMFICFVFTEQIERMQQIFLSFLHFHLIENVFKSRA